MTQPLDILRERLRRLNNDESLNVWRRTLDTYLIFNGLRRHITEIDGKLAEAAETRDSALQTLGRSALAEPESFHLTGPFDFVETMAQVSHEKARLAEETGKAEEDLRSRKSRLGIDALAKEKELSKAIVDEKSALQRFRALPEEDRSTESGQHWKTEHEIRRGARLAHEECLAQIRSVGDQEIALLTESLDGHLHALLQADRRSDSVERDLGRALTQSDHEQVPSPQLAGARQSLLALERLQDERIAALTVLAEVDTNPLRRASISLIILILSSFAIWLFLR